MSPVVATVIIGVATLLSAALIAAAGALWRLGSKVGGFEAAVAAANVAATQAKTAATEAQAAAQRASADAIAAARHLWDDMQRAVRDFEQKVQDAQQKVMDHSARVLDRMAALDLRLDRIEREHRINHDPPVSAKFVVAEEGAPLLPGAPDDALFEVVSEPHHKGDPGGKR